MSPSKELQPLCYEHLTEMMHLPDMMLHENDLLKAKEGTAFVCSELSCPVSYNTLDGYFIAAAEGDRVEKSRAPRVFCPNDRTPMYLAEIHPEHKSYRLWKCP